MFGSDPLYSFMCVFRLNRETINELGECTSIFPDPLLEAWCKFYAGGQKIPDVVLRDDDLWEGPPTLRDLITEMQWSITDEPIHLLKFVDILQQLQLGHKPIFIVLSIVGRFLGDFDFLLQKPYYEVVVTID